MSARGVLNMTLQGTSSRAPLGSPATSITTDSGRHIEFATDVTTRSMSPSPSTAPTASDDTRSAPFEFMRAGPRPPPLSDAFQAWLRDANPTSSSNFTDAVSVTFHEAPRESRSPCSKRLTRLGPACSMGLRPALPGHSRDHPRSRSPSKNPLERMSSCSAFSAPVAWAPQWQSKNSVYSASGSKGRPARHSSRPRRMSIQMSRRSS